MAKSVSVSWFQLWFILLGCSLTHTACHAGWIPRRRITRNHGTFPTLDRGGADEAQEKKMTYDVSVCAHQGGRSYMEDEHFVSHGGDFCAVFDGHGGGAVSRYLRQNLYANLQAELPSVTRGRGAEEMDEASSSPAARGIPTSLEDYENALIRGLDKVDREVQRISHWSYQGSTAVAVWLHEEKDTLSITRTVLAANVGDSRAVLSRAAVAIDITQDHKPSEQLEKERIERAGGKVVWCGDTTGHGEPILDAGVYRVNGNLALSRAIGDRSERPAVTAVPDVTSYRIEPSDDFIVLASDGVWDVMSSQDVVSFIHSKLNENDASSMSEYSSGQYPTCLSAVMCLCLYFYLTFL